MISSVDIAESRLRFSSCFVLDQPRDAVERHAAVVADDAAAAVGVGQSGQDVRAAAGLHVGGVGVEDAFVVRLAVLGECLDDMRDRARSRRS